MEEKQYLFMEYNLQWFAKEGEGGEKTEPATAKKLTDAREKGQVSKSKELSSAVDLIVLFLILKIFISFIGQSMLEFFPVLYHKIPDIVNDSAGGISTFTVVSIVNNTLLTMLTILAPVFAIGFMVAVLINLVQVGWKPTTKPMEPKFSKINPISGFKKIFSKDSLFELVKSIVKITLIVYVAYTAVVEHQNELFLLYDIPLMQVIIMIGEIVLDAGLKISVIYLFVGVADFIYEKHKFSEDMKMTKKEVKDEMKNTEGSPEIKGRQRSKMREVSQQRMMQDVPKADVVITNPTHLAVAIKYDSDKSRAPVVVAKGADFLAQKIREIAKENKIELVENKPLARMLYANVEIGAEVPPELYQAVAEVLAFVYSLKNK